MNTNKYQMHIMVTLIALLLLFSGCGGGGGSSNSSSDNDESVYSVTIGPTGGTFQVTDEDSALFGFMIDVPEGILSAQTEFKISPSTSPIDCFDDYTDITEQFQIVADAELNGYIGITCPIKTSAAANDLIIVTFYDEKTGSCGTLPAADIDIAGKKIRFITDHLTVFKGQKISDISSIPNSEMTGFNILMDCFSEEYIPASGISAGLANYSLWYYLNHEHGLRCAWDEQHAGEIAQLAWNTVNKSTGALPYWEYLERTRSDFESYYSSDQGNLSALISKLLKGEPEVLNLLMNGGQSGLSVMVYGYSKVNNSTIIFDCYDPNYPGQVMKLICSRASGLWVFAYQGAEDDPYDYEFDGFFPLNSHDKCGPAFAKIKSDFSPMDNWCHDLDKDNIPSDLDNCPGVKNLDQKDSDSEGIGDACDNCPQIANPNQEDTDQDGIGDACDGAVVNDSDGDGVADEIDNCPAIANPDQADSDKDGIGDVCDTLLPQDSDEDGVADETDNCPAIANPDQADADGDGIGDACDDSGEVDADGDGVPDDRDLCPATSPGEMVGSDGCPVSPADADGDGVSNDNDLCPNTLPGETVGSDGCPAAPQDSDGDGVTDSQDLCPNTFLGESVDANGCPITQPDADGDGVTDNHDLCPNTLLGETVDADGCPLNSQDSDNDGVPDNQDLCPDTPLGAPVDGGGCPLNPIDSDGDGVPNDLDLCPGSAPGLPVDANGCPVS